MFDTRDILNYFSSENIARRAELERQKQIKKYGLWGYRLKQLPGIIGTGLFFLILLCWFIVLPILGIVHVVS
ncbi:hypothetical protein VPHD479_0377 [Vibrio phage D479]